MPHMRSQVIYKENHSQAPVHAQGGSVGQDHTYAVVFDELACIDFVLNSGRAVSRVVRAFSK